MRQLKPTLFNFQLQNFSFIKPNTLLIFLSSFTSLLAQQNEDLGHTYHDDSNLAAVLVNHNAHGNLQMDGTIGSDYVIKPMPSNVELSAAHLDELSARDDDEMFLDEDEFASAPSHQTTNTKPTNKSSSNTGSNTSSNNNSNNNKSKPSTISQTGSRTIDANATDLTDGARQPYSSSHVPKLHKLADDAEEDERQALKLKKLKKLERRKQAERGAHIVYKKWKAPKESHSDFIELEPGSHGFHGHFVPNSNWTLLHQFPKPLNDRHPSNSNNNSNQGVQFDENLYDELELAHSFDSQRYSAPPSTGHRRSKRQAPDTVWPEVLLVVDYDSYLLHGANSRDVKRYFISFWNGVDLRYKLLSHPTIRISLAGMIVAKVRLFLLFNKITKLSLLFFPSF